MGSLLGVTGRDCTEMLEHGFEGVQGRILELFDHVVEGDVDDLIILERFVFGIGKPGGVRFEVIENEVNVCLEHTIKSLEFVGFLRGSIALAFEHVGIALVICSIRNAVITDIRNLKITSKIILQPQIIMLSRCISAYSVNKWIDKIFEVVLQPNNISWIKIFIVR